MGHPDTLKLINAVKLHKCLFDTDHLHYRNLNKRSEAWLAIATSLKSNKRTCQVKWKTLRDHYVKEYWQLRSQQEDSDAEGSPPTWRWFSHLSFLDEYLKQRKCVKITPSVESLIPEKKIDMRSVVKHNHNGNTLDNIPLKQIKKEEPLDEDDIAPFAAIDIPIDDSTSPYEFENVSTPLDEIIISEPLEQKYSASPASGNVYMNGNGGVHHGGDQKISQQLTKLMNIVADQSSLTKSKHSGFMQMMDDMLNQLSETEQRNTKMFILNYLHEKTMDSPQML